VKDVLVRMVTWIVLLRVALKSIAMVVIRPKENVVQFVQRGFIVLRSQMKEFISMETLGKKHLVKHVNVKEV